MAYCPGPGSDRTEDTLPYHRGWEDDLPFPKVGHVSFQEGKSKSAPIQGDSLLRDANLSHLRVSKSKINQCQMFIYIYMCVQYVYVCLCVVCLNCVCFSALFFPALFTTKLGRFLSILAHHHKPHLVYHQHPPLEGDRQSPWYNYDSSVVVDHRCPGQHPWKANQWLRVGGQSHLEEFQVACDQLGSFNPR